MLYDPTTIQILHDNRTERLRGIAVRRTGRSCRRGSTGIWLRRPRPQPRVLHD